MAWLPGGKAFYYVRRLPPGQVPAGEEQFHRRVYLHRVGTPAEDDVLIHGDGLDKINYYGVLVSRDGRWLIIDASAGTAPRNDVWIADLTASEEAAPDLQVLQQGVDALVGVRAGRDGRLYLLTDRDAPRWRLAVADPADPRFPAYESWQRRAPRGPRGGARRRTPCWTGPSWTGRCWWRRGPGTRSARSACTTWPPAPRSASGCRCPAWAR